MKGFLFGVLFIAFQVLLTLFSMSAGDALTAWGRSPTTENSRTAGGLLFVVLLCEAMSILCIIGMVWF